MPELPEVETTRRGLAPRVLGRRVAAVHVYDRRLRWPVPAGLERRLRGQTIHAIERRAKFLLFGVGAGQLLVHLGMTGSLRWYAGAPPRRAHDHLDIELDDGAVLRYHDPRRFGCVLWIEEPARGHRLLDRLGPEPLDESFDADYLWAAARRRGAAIKLVLMDNHVVVGVGNIYANEALFRAGIRPTRPARRVGRAAIARLVQAVRETLAEAIAAGGSTLRDYVDSAGAPGRFQLAYNVYGRAGEPCRRCGRRVKLVRLGGRATTWCPACQR